MSFFGQPAKKATPPESTARDCVRSACQWELGNTQHVALPMTRRDDRSGFPHYGRWSYPWRSEDDWGPITAAVVLLILLAGVIVYSGVQLYSGVHL